MIRALLLLLLVPVTLGANNSKWRSKWIYVESTGYCPCVICTDKQPGDPGYAVTATGRDAWKSGVAVDPRVIPLGSYLDIPNYPRTNGTSKAPGAWIKADDVGGAIKGKRIDLRFLTHQKALNWGVKMVRVRVWTKQ